MATLLGAPQQFAVRLSTGARPLHCGRTLVAIVPFSKEYGRGGGNSVGGQDMRIPVLRAVARSFTIAVMGLTLLAASPSSVVAATQLNDDDGPGLQQVPSPGSGSAPVQHVPGNAGTGDASAPSGGSKSKAGAKSGKSGADSGDSDERGCGSDNSLGSDDSDDGDEGPCPTPTATPTPTPTPTPTATPTPSPTTATSVVRTEVVTIVSGSQEFRVVRIFNNNTLVHEVFVPVSTSGPTVVTARTSDVVENGETIRVVQVFTNGVLTNEVRVTRSGTPTVVLGSQQGPADAAAAVTSPMTLGQSATGQTNVAGQQSAADPLGISSLPSTTPLSPAVPVGALGALIVAGGAWLLGRNRKQ